MKSGMNVPIFREAVLAQAIVISIPAHVPHVINDLLAGIAHIEKGVGRFVKDELHDHRSRQHALPQRIELKEVALTESQKLVSFV